MCQQCARLDYVELVRRNQSLEHENAHLRGAVQRAYCGSISDSGVSCQLARGHEGCSHAWVSPDGALILKWE